MQLHFITLVFLFFITISRHNALAVSLGIQTVLPPAAASEVGLSRIPPNDFEPMLFTPIENK